MNKYNFKYADIEIRQNAFKIQWGAENFGFGEFYFKVNEDGTTEMDTEYMGEDFVEQLLKYLISKTKQID